MGDLDISFSGFISTLLFSTIGIWLFREGKRRTNYAFLFIAIGLMFYSYFTTGPLEDWGVGIVLCVAAYMLRGWN